MSALHRSRRFLVPVAATVLLLAGCGTDRFLSGAVRYSCDNGVQVTVRPDGSAVVRSGRGEDLLLRDAGGVGPLQQVFSNPQMRFETGLGAAGTRGRIEGMVPNRNAGCVRTGGALPQTMMAPYTPPQH